ncbi:MAG: hypothetical protein ABGX04_01255 [Myxococcales bacterium]|nr:hypothetical protein [Myxococcales bacterium]HIK86366.1 hypothetical protein [Myxococcales bacterium]
MKNRTSIRGVLTLLIILASVAGCAGGGPGSGIVIPGDPTATPQASLESLFSEIGVQIEAAKPGSKAAIQLQQKLKTIGSELAERAASAVRTRLFDVDRVEGRIPLSAIEREMGNLNAIKRWDMDVHQKISDEFNEELESTQRSIGEGEQSLANLSKDRVSDKLQIIEKLLALSGADSESQTRYAQQRNDILSDVSKEAEEAILNEDYEKAQGLLSIVQEVNPDDEASRQRKCEVDGKIVLKRFTTALETGRFGRSMGLLTEFSETDCFGEIKDGLAEMAEPIVEAFGLLGEEAATSNQMAVAYHRYKDSRTISDLLLDEKNDLPGISAFLGQVYSAHQKAFKAGEFGVAWGCLGVMTEFGTTTPKIRQSIRRTKDELNRRAIPGLTAYPFEDSENASAKVGDAVASKVVQHIFRTIPSDVLIVEREQLERILDECTRTDTCTELDTADFIVQGTILDAKVETTRKVGSETLRIVTGAESVTNPEHARWSLLKDKQRADTMEPARTIDRDVTEDITMEVTNVRKVGIISVAYRVVDAATGRVLFTDSIQTKQTHQDEGRQGIKLGNFEQETDFVELPPDIEILSGGEGLSQIISNEIGTKLVEFLKNPEEQYANDAKRFVNEGDFVGAAQQAAFAIVLLEIKSKEIGMMREELKDFAMKSQQY